MPAGSLASAQRHFFTLIQFRTPPHLGNVAAHSVQGLPTSTHFIKAFPYSSTQCRQSLSETPLPGGFKLGQGNR